MAEKKTTKAAATKAAKATEKEVKAPKKACAKKTETKATAKKAAVVYVTADNAGFRAGDVYQALAAAEKALTVAELVKLTKVSNEDVLLGLGWLLKEGKVTSTEDNKVTLA